MKHSTAALAVALALVAISCAKTPDLAEVTATTSTATTSSTPSSSSTADPTTTTESDAAPGSTTTTSIEQPATTSTTTTTTEADDAAPTPPSGLACAATSGTDVTVTWAAPPVEEEVARYKLYVDVGDGPFVQRGTVDLADAAAVDPDELRHGATVSPVPVATPVSIAVTAFDAAGNESGWNPLDVWFLGNGGSCNSGAPPAVDAATISRGAGSSEVNMTFLAPADDVASYETTVEQAGGAPSVVLVQPAGQSVAVVIGGVDYESPFTIGVTAVDHHGNASDATTFECPSLAVGSTC